MRRLIALVLSGVAAMAALGGTVLATSPISNFTDHFHREEGTFYDVSFCDEAQAWEINEIGTGVFHVTENANGTYHVTGTFLGRVEILPIENALVEGEDGFEPVGDIVYEEDAETFKGRYTQWFGENGNRTNGNGTFTFSVTLFGSEGTVLHVHAVAHITFDSTGDPVVEFERFNVIGCD